MLLLKLYASEIMVNFYLLPTKQADYHTSDGFAMADEILICLPSFPIDNLCCRATAVHSLNNSSFISKRFFNIRVTSLHEQRLGIVHQATS